MYENPLYEQRRNLDRQAGLASEASGKKRKHEEGSDSKEREEKTKHKKEKRDKEKKKEEDAVLPNNEKYKVKKEEEEDKPKLGKKEQDLKKCQEPEKSYIKKDEDEKYKYSKKDDKYRSNRDEEDRISRYRNSNRDEYQYNYHRDGSDRYEERAKYGSKDDDKYKQEKYSEVRSKFNRDQDEGKPKTERGIDKPTGEPEVSKSGPPPKPYELPKILCGPSPAMRAKLRKQSLESGKSPATSASFGRFTWKKKENQLAKEAQKVAAEFIKEDEMAANEQASMAEDSFAKSMAFAKGIAQKLAGEQPMAPPWITANRGRIRPNLPPPTTQLRKTAMAGKPASLSTFLNIRPQSTCIPGPPSGSTIRPPNVHTPTSQTSPGTSFPTPGIFNPQPAPTLTKSEPFGPKLPPSMTKPEIQAVNSAQSRVKSEPTEIKVASSKAKEEPTGSKPGVVESKLPPFQVSSAPPVSEASTVKSKPTPDAKFGPAEERSSEVVPEPPAPTKNAPVEPAVIKIVSDVAAPGVPESEQTCTVFVKPPPFRSKMEGPHKSEKVKSNLAAAKAQDLFGIFYSSGGQQGPSSFCRPETDDKSLFAVPQAPQPQSKTKSQSSFQTQSQPQDEQQSSNPALPQLQDKPQFSNPPQLQPQDKLQSSNPTQQLPQDKPQCKTEDPPLDKTRSELNPPAEPHSQLLSLTDIQPPAKVQISPQLDSNNYTPSPQTQTESDIQIISVWSIQPTTASVAEGVPTTQSTPPHYDQPFNTLSECHINSQIKSSNVGHTDKPQTDNDCFKAESQSEFQLGQDTLSQLQMAPEPQPKPKPSPKSRGKSAQVKKTPPASAPSRQTRSQTRYQTRQQQHQSPSEPDLANTESLESSDPESQAQLKAETTDKDDPSEGETTPETLGLPFDMTSTEFTYNFE
uniref:Zinc finger protein 318 n=1 Tax=Nothobranchius kadleci TaxID=1051664 RepID=A0A1A8BQQ1_NOTKA